MLSYESVSGQVPQKLLPKLQALAYGKLADVVVMYGLGNRPLLRPTMSADGIQAQLVGRPVAGH